MAYDRAMDRRVLIAAVRLGLAALALVAIAAQIASDAIAGALQPVDLLSSFAIQSNLIGAVAFVTAAAGWRRGGGASVDLLRGGAAVYLAATALVASPLLAGADAAATIPRAGTVLQVVLPAAAIVDWVVLPPLTRIPFRDSLLWLAYPVLWTAYTMLRGPAAGWYPYPLLDPANGGSGIVAARIVGILALEIAVCVVVSALSRRAPWRLSAD